jgi:hypothetical protein
VQCSSSGRRIISVKKHGIDAEPVVTAPSTNKTFTAKNENVTAVKSAQSTDDVQALKQQTSSTTWY